MTRLQSERGKAIRLLWGLLDKQSSDFTSLVLTCMAEFFSSLKEWETLYLHRVMAVLLRLKFHHPPHEQFALHFKIGVEAHCMWFCRIRVD